MHVPLTPISNVLQSSPLTLVLPPEEPWNHCPVDGSFSPYLE